MAERRVDPNSGGVATRTVRRRVVLRVLAGGVLIGSVGVIRTPRVVRADLETGFRVCAKCRGLWFPAGDDKGRCPARRGHDARGSAKLALNRNVPPGPNDEAGWRYCKLCNGIWFFGSGGMGACPATNSGHDTADANAYVIEFNQPPGPAEQGGWRYCPKCRGLFKPKGRSRGVCPAGGKHKPFAGFVYNLPLAD